MKLMAVVGAILLVAGNALAQAHAPATTLFENVMVFDGTSDALTGPSNVLVKGNVIATISTEPVTAEGATRIAGDGRTLMPGLIDAHWHALLVRPTPAEATYGDVGFNNLLAGAEATDTLMRGFTTVRDMGGPVFGLKQAIDDGIVLGPRIYPSGAIITVTSGHGDFRQLSELPRIVGGPLTRMEAIGGSMVADSPDEVRLRVREQLMLGASQIKLTAGGGVASPHSPLDVSTFTAEELRAATEAAGNWGTYVAVHSYTSAAIQRAIAEGVKVIEHGHLMDDATAQMMAEQGIWLSTQPFLDDEDAIPFPPGSDQAAKQQEVITGTDNVYRLAKKYGVKTAFGTDTLFSAELAKRQGAQLAKLVRWYTPAETLTMATSANGELLQLTGLRNPYPGKLGVVQEGALADLLLVEGNPLEDIDLIADPERSFVVIMKDGVVVKNSIPQ
jgi:imidazolonepropionase-like amidohydrolase